ncbi:hypothetical protein TNCV_3479381 [Trichonephila clavipes]|nr:hypothetical protein TNCV_3479381 [Trichonephila clavipes]
MNFEPWSSDEDDDEASTTLIASSGGRLSFDIFNIHRPLTRWVFNGTGLELLTAGHESVTLNTRPITIHHHYSFIQKAAVG